MQSWKLILLFLLGLFILILLRHAWVTEDAYITFRTVDNFVNGHGLVWNVGERVQAYTHPLWMALHILPFKITHEFFYTTIFISVITSLAAVALYAWKTAESPTMAAIGLLVLIGSKSFMDFSASGLENPLTHLSIITFAIVYLPPDHRPNRILWLSVFASMGLLTRLDTLFFFFPALAWEVWRERSKRSLGLLLLGLTPIILWELFSLFYYGFPFPNTAYAKLSTGISHTQLCLQGLSYLLQSIAYDPITLLITGMGIISMIFSPKWRLFPLSVGILLQLLYVVYVGGDFMSGRFLSGSLLMSVVVLSNNGFPLDKLHFAPVALVVLLVGLISPYPTFFSTEDYGQKRTSFVDYRGIADERAVYYPRACLLRASRGTEMPIHQHKRDGLELRDHGEQVAVRQAIGYLGYFAGPKVHIVDTCALTDPLLARLPQSQGDDWRVGHYLRKIPEGYVESVRTGQNHIRDRDLAAYYEKLNIITSGPLFSFNRLAVIAKMNLGFYDDLLDH